MATITLRLDARQLESPDLDLRYAIPDLLSDRSNGLIRDGGYDYENDHVLAIYLLADDALVATALIEDVLWEVVILDNHLAGRSRSARNHRHRVFVQHGRRDRKGARTGAAAHVERTVTLVARATPAPRVTSRPGRAAMKERVAAPV